MGWRQEAGGCCQAANSPGAQLGATGAHVLQALVRENARRQRPGAHAQASCIARDGSSVRGRVYSLRGQSLQGRARAREWQVGRVGVGGGRQQQGGREGVTGKMQRRAGSEPSTPAPPQHPASTNNYIAGVNHWRVLAGLWLVHVGRLWDGEARHRGQGSASPMPRVHAGVQQLVLAGGQGHATRRSRSHQGLKSTAEAKEGHGKSLKRFFEVFIELLEFD